MASALVLQNVIDRKLSLHVSIDRLKGFSGSLPGLKEITFGCCRFYGVIDYFLNGFLQKPIKDKDRIIHFLLISAIYQIDYMKRPSHAVVNECVESLKKTKQSWAKNLINGVLRNTLRSDKKASDALDLDGMDEHIGYAFPKSLFDLIKTDWPQHYKKILAASNDRPPLTLRVNQSKLSRQEYEVELENAGIDYQLTPDSDFGVTLSIAMAVQEIPGFLEGFVSVQDESAQLIVDAMDLQAGQTILDGCAAPGGKTGLILESNNRIKYLTVVDLPERVSAIDQNLQRIGLSANVVAADLLNRDVWWDGEQFDRILLDAPCSGSGVIRRHADIKHRRSDKDIERFATQQLHMLNAVWPTLKTGGRLLYVTCSILRAENDNVVRKFTKKSKGFELEYLDDITGISTDYGIQRLPGIQSGDGFYYCSLIKVTE